MQRVSINQLNKTNNPIEKVNKGYDIGFISKVWNTVKNVNFAYYGKAAY